MTTLVRSFLPVTGEPPALIRAFSAAPEAWLRPVRRERSGDYVVELRGGGLRRAVRVRLGPAWSSGTTTWRTLHWDPVLDASDPASVERLLPDLDAELGLHIDDDGRATLLLDGRYQPPGRALGAAADAVVLRRIAHATVRRFLDDVAARLAAAAVLADDTVPTG